ncbi:MAG: hypothetical protein ACRENE_04780 [Polyangiaceae bacterium]
MFSYRSVVLLALAGVSPVLSFVACGSSNSSPGAFTGDDGPSGSSGGSGNDATMGDDGGTSSSSSSGGGGSSSGSGLVMYDGPPPNVDGGMLACTTPNGLSVKFNPVYSGFDGTHTYQVPVFAEGVDPSTVTWGASDPSYVSMQPYVTGVMITTRKAGEVDIIARSGSKCGTTHLTITQFQASDWTAGNARYNNGNGLNLNILALPPALAGMVNDGGFTSPDGSMYDASSVCTSSDFMGLTNPFEMPPAQCTNCHGAGSNGVVLGKTIFSDVQHTPEQTGGYSDSQLTNMFVNGVVPDGGYFASSITPECIWSRWHQWQDIDSGAEQTGVLSYLRAIVPQEQTGCFDLLNTPMCSDGGN